MERFNPSDDVAQRPASPPQPSDRVRVTLLLAGGHQCALDLETSDPILDAFFEAIAARSKGQAPAPRLFQVPMRGDRALVCFASTDLVGMVTEPPITMPTQALATVPARSTDPDAAAVLPSQVLQIENFLSAAEHQALLEYTLQREATFVPTSTSTGAADYRKSVVLHHFPEFSGLMLQKIRDRLPQIQKALHLAPFAIGQIESQLTAHNDDNFYKIHNDNGSPDTATRELTYVYYFYQEPQQFSGGELRVYDSKVENNYYVQADSCQTVIPRNNSIVFFLSRYMHEVLPVRCPSRQFAHSRFTINGWVRRR
jgi:Rps23 Pro-64 3,4-dihydroxylase Tpa1-like proline 4-hydroxylase